MTVRHVAPGGFPDDEGADDFVREFRQAVAPAERESLAHTPPLIILDVQSDDTEYDGRVRRVLGELEDSLRGGGDRKLVPYTLVTAVDDSDLLSGTAARGLALGLPKNMTPDRLPGFWPLWDSVSYMRQHAGDRSAPGAHVLRDHAHEQLRLHRGQRREGRLQVFLWALGGSAAPPGRRTARLAARLRLARHHPDLSALVLGTAQDPPAGKPRPLLAPRTPWLAGQRSGHHRRLRNRVRGDGRGGRPADAPPSSAP
ncbi:hypothetical protein AB0I22_13615 [Streptomyces sp. NPDC050610]|uniref:hypothetical protein n=1 Tax=Streptomyces sp. NPDC050610 TaxID=3157097 RepID=UPI003431F1F5